jgi:hypothetical protein
VVAGVAAANSSSSRIRGQRVSLIEYRIHMVTICTALQCQSLADASSAMSCSLRTQSISGMHASHFSEHLADVGMP